MFKCEIKTGGAAFCEPLEGTENDYYEEQEVGRLLDKVSTDIKAGVRSGVIMDINGNKVGKWELD